MVTVTIAFRNDNPDTIWNRLALKLGRQPTQKEAAQEVRRITASAYVDIAKSGRLRHQRR